MKRYMIGEVAKIVGLSVHTLRYYEKNEVIKPSYVDEITGYRYYTPNDISRLCVLKECKKMDLTLGQIRKVYEASSHEEVMAIIDEKKDEVLKMIEHYNVTLKNIEWYRSEYNTLCETKRMCYVPFLQHLPTRRVIYRANPYEEDSSSLALAEVAEKQLEETDTIKKKYGFIANTKYWVEETSLRVTGEYVDINVDEYDHVDSKYIYRIPGGLYLCMNIAHSSDLEDDEVDILSIPQLELLKDYVKDHKYEEKLVLVEEFTKTLKVFNKVRCQVQILLEVQEDV